MAAVGTVGRSAAACGLWSLVVRPGLFRLHGLRDLGPCGVEEALRQAARPRNELRGLELRGLELGGLDLRDLELRGLELAWSRTAWSPVVPPMGSAGWVERLGLCGRGLCWARAQRPRFARPQVATPPIVRPTRIMRGREQSPWALCGLESSCLPPCGLGSGPSPDGLSGLGLCVSGREA